MKAFLPHDMFQAANPYLLLIMVWAWLGIVSFCFYRFGLFKSQEKVEVDSGFTSSILALLAFIMGFSFSMAVSRYEERKSLAVQEANAISTAYLQSKLISFKDKETVNRLFLEYVDKRIEAYQSKDPFKILEKLDSIEAEIWSKLIEVSKKNQGPLVTSFTNSLNHFFDTANERKYALFKLLPSPFYFLILLLATVSLCIQNYDRALNRNKEHWKIGLFVFLFGLIFFFIFDLDHSRKGFIRVGQEPLIELRSKM